MPFSIPKLFGLVVKVLSNDQLKLASKTIDCYISICCNIFLDEI